MVEFEDIAFQNPHWFGKADVPPKRRRIYAELEKGLGNRLIYSVQGIRRVGKTTLMRQLIAHLAEKKGVKPERMLYFSFDDNPGEPKEVIRKWSSRFGFDIRKGGLYVFFDEIQKVEAWGGKLKILYDNTLLKFFISGSASLLLNKGRESLAGREFSFELPPFAFDEWLEFCGLKREHADFGTYEKYLGAQFPQVALGGAEGPEYARSIIAKVLEHDIPKAYGIGYSDKAGAILNSMLKMPGQLVEFNDVAKDFGLSRDTVSKYFHALEGAFLLRKVENALPNARKSEKALKKYYPYAPSLISSVLPYPVDFSLIAEADVAFQLGAKHFLNVRGREIDFLVGEGLSCGVEVKMRNRVDRTDVSFLLSTSLKSKYVVVKPDSRVDVSGATVITPMDLMRIKGL